MVKILVYLAGNSVFPYLYERAPNPQKLLTSAQPRRSKRRPPSGALPGGCSPGLRRNAATERAPGSQEPRIAACRRWAAARPPNRGLGRGSCVSGVKPGPNRAAVLGTWELRTDFRRRPPVTGRPDRGMYGRGGWTLGPFRVSRRRARSVEITSPLSPVPARKDCRTLEYCL